ncbi:MAG TPA: hypothetical protein VK163_02450 [Opitutaceae bacterium]|nr:hypothetical protein [Opitutaceae bacterium]
MNAEPLPRLPLRTRLCALVLAWQVFFVGLLAASPSLHALAHHDADTDAHPCAVAMFHQGVAPLAAALPAPVPNVPAFSERLPVAVTVVRSAAALRLPPTCGPPRS